METAYRQRVNYLSGVPPQGSTYKEETTFNLIKIQMRKKVSEGVRSHRLSMGISQVALAKAVGLTNHTICNVEKGRSGLSLASIEDICQVLEIDMALLLAGV